MQAIQFWTKKYANVSSWDVNFQSSFISTACSDLSLVNSVVAAGNHRLLSLLTAENGATAVVIGTRSGRCLGLERIV
jgi:hypothetical protein